MSKGWKLTSLVVALLLARALVAYGQGAANVSIDDVQVDDFPRTRALVTVRDANGVPISGLTADKFELVEDAKASFSPAEVQTQVNPAMTTSVVLVIDISGSMKGKPIDEAIRAANALIDLLSPLDRVAVIAFADDVNLDPTQLNPEKEYGFTTDKNAVRNVINFLNTKLGWNTPLYDAMYKGVKMASSEPAGKRAVVLLTDGRDERDNAQGVAVKDKGSLMKPDDPINEANRFNIPIFTVGLKGLGGKMDSDYLKRVAQRTGATYQETPQPEDLTPAFQNVVNQLKEQYILIYDSTLKVDDQWHSLMVRVLLPQGQGFSERKFALGNPKQPTTALTSTPASPEALPPATEVAQQTAEPSGAAQATATPVAGEESGQGTWFQTLLDTFRERPLLAVVIGLGLLLLLALIIALVVVLLRGRRGQPEETGIGEIPYTPAPAAWQPSTGPTPQPVLGSEEATNVSPTPWGPPTPGPPLVPPVSGVETGPEIPVAGGTKLIERAPKHLALLVDKARPERKYDLKGMTNIGRARSNQIVIDDPTVSRQHAWIKAEGEEFTVFDVGSANGTFVNDEAVTEPRRLENGDVVRFGDAAYIFTRLF